MKLLLLLLVLASCESAPKHIQRYQIPQEHLEGFRKLAPYLQPGAPISLPDKNRVWWEYRIDAGEKWRRLN